MRITKPGTTIRGEIRPVTNLNDDGEGSFREALAIHSEEVIVREIRRDRKIQWLRPLRALGHFFALVGRYDPVGYARMGPIRSWQVAWILAEDYR
jgi:hypothetical protein